MIEVVLLVPIAVFLQTIASEAAKDVYPLVKEWVKDVWATARSGVGDEGGVGESSVLLAERLPDEAIEALTEVDWDQFQGGWLHWDDDARRWRDWRRV